MQLQTVLQVLKKTDDNQINVLQGITNRKTWENY